MLTAHACEGRFCRVSSGQCTGCNFGDGCGVNVSAAEWIADLPRTSSPLQAAVLAVTAEDHANMCAACTDEQGQYLWNAMVEYNNILLMKWRDWLALCLCALFLGLHAADELRNVKICELILRLNTGSSEQRIVGSGWRLTLWLLCAVRQFLVLVHFGVCSVVLVISQGGDVFSVCLYSVAVLFLLAVDDALFAHGLPDATRVWLQHMAAVEMDARESRTHAWLKVSCIVGHVVGIPVSCGLRLALPATGWYDWTTTTCSPLFFLTMIVPLFVEPAARGGTLREQCACCGWLTFRLIIAFMANYAMHSYGVN